MTLALIGVNHKTAPIEVREKVAISRDELPEVTRALAAMPGVSECMIVSTCNRVELLAAVESPAVDLSGFLQSQFGLDGSVLKDHLYEHHDQQAVRHLFRVASSLDSMVVGEPQILGQVKEAFGVARTAGTVGTQLEYLLQSAFAAAKKVRSETEIGSNSVSIASVAVELARKIFGSLNGRTVFLVGAGKMSELAARHLVQQGAGAILVTNRTLARARTMAEDFDGRVIPFEQLYEAASDADIVITSTGAPHAIFRREHGVAFLHRRKNRPMFFIDIAVPRDVDPAMNKLEGIFVYDIDDLQTGGRLAHGGTHPRSRQCRGPDRRGGGALPPASADSQCVAGHRGASEAGRRAAPGGIAAHPGTAGHIDAGAGGSRRSVDARPGQQIPSSSHAGAEAGRARQRFGAHGSTVRDLVAAYDGAGPRSRSIRRRQRIPRTFL